MSDMFPNLEPFFALVGAKRWRDRIAAIHDMESVGSRVAQTVRQHYAIELALEKCRRRPSNYPSVTENLLGQVVDYIAVLSAGLTQRGRNKLIELIFLGLSGQNSLMPVFHLIRTAIMQQSRGFVVRFPCLEEDTPYDLLIRRGGTEAELCCDVVSAEVGRSVQRGAWARLTDIIEPDVQAWLDVHPGRYLLKMTLPLGLRGGWDQSVQETDKRMALHQRILALLESRSRQHLDETIVLRLDPLVLASAQADDTALASSLRREFGPEASLAVITSGRSICVMAARAGRENDVAGAIRQRLSTLAATRLTGQRAGILSMFVDGIDRAEWRGLRDRLELEGETRHFMTNTEALSVIAVSFVSRVELFGLGELSPKMSGELRFRNPRHPAANSAALAPAVTSSV